MHLARRSKWYAAAVCFALATLLRPDSFIVGLPLAVLCIRELRLQSWKPMALAVVLSMSWFVFATVYIGSPLPQSARANVSSLHERAPAK